MYLAHEEERARGEGRGREEESTSLKYETVSPDRLPETEEEGGRVRGVHRALAEAREALAEKSAEVHLTTLGP